jgi:hypothetical protein
MRRRLPRRRYHDPMNRPATDPQLTYLRRLLDSCFAKRITHGLCLDRHHLDRVTVGQASAAIETLKGLLELHDQLRGTVEEATFAGPT